MSPIVTVNFPYYSEEGVIRDIVINITRIISYTDNGKSALIVVGRDIYQSQLSFHDFNVLYKKAVQRFNGYIGDYE